MHIDVGGSLPDMIRKKIGQAQSESIFNLIKYIKKNYKA